ncbi:MAG: CHAT domain-containing protein [bacterium]
MRTLDRLRNGKGFYLFDGVLIASIIYLIVFPQPSLQDYERRCRETADPQKKEKIALAAVDFLARQSVPDSIAHQVNQAVASENLSLPPNTLLFPEILAITNDSLAGLCDGLLTENLPKLYWMRRNQPNSVRGENFSAAKKIAAQVDAWLKFSYWVPLMEFWEKADAETWQRWRGAARAADLSRIAYNQSQFERAKFLAVSGFHSLVAIPDRRLYLDICFRLQNAIADGPESMFNIGFALTDWVTRESRNVGYFLRIVSLEFNCGNQLFHMGRYDEALERIKNVLELTQQWRYFQPTYMQWYASEAMERITAVLYELGDYSGMLNYLAKYGTLATETRQKTLYHIDRGMAARLIGDFQTAEEEFQKAIECGQKVDPANVWYAYLDLGDLYLEYALPEKALAYFQNAKAYVANDENFLNGEKLSDFWLHVAEAFVQKQAIDSAKSALEQAKQQFIDSPVLRVKSLFSAAKVHENLRQLTKAAEMLAQAREICQKFGMTIYEVDAILRQTALSFNAPKDSKPPEYSAKDLETLIARVNKSGAKRQLVHSLSLAVDAASRGARYDQAKPYAEWLWQETEALSRLYDQEQRLIFFQHSTYEKVKAAINLDIRLGDIDAAFVKLDYLKARALRRKLANSPAAIAANANLPYINLHKLQSQLRPDEAILDYMVAEDTLYVFVLTPSERRMFSSTIAKRELQALVREYLAELTREKGNYNEQHSRQEFLKAIQLSHTLYSKLLGKMAEFLEKINRLYIVPDEFLNALPFSTLALQDSLEPEFLISRKAVMYLPAASFLSIEGDAKKNILVQPDVLASVDSTIYGASKISRYLVSLENKEVTVRTQWENQAEIEACLAGRYQTYFFYAHADANWDDPWQSYIQFPLKHPSAYGKLTYADVDSLDWQAAVLVILAGCETTGNRIYSGAGLSGLQRSFLGAGAKQVLATFWKVDAGQVASQILNFLEAWHRHGDAVLAFQQMQQVAIARLKADPYLNHYPHPRYWGAYNLTGTKSTLSFSHEYAARSLQ